MTTSDDEIDRIVYTDNPPEQHEPKWVIEEDPDGRSYRIWISPGDGSRWGPDGFWWTSRSYRRALILAKRHLAKYLEFSQPVNKWEGTL